MAQTVPHRMSVLLGRVTNKFPNKGAIVKMNIHKAVGDLSALQDAIKRGENVNSVNGVSWFVGM